MKCPYCSKEIMDGAVWCRHCQNHLDDLPDPGVSAVAAPAAPRRPWAGGAGRAPVIDSAAPPTGARPPGGFRGGPDVGGTDATFDRSRPTEIDERQAERRRVALAEIQTRLDEVQGLMDKGKLQAAANEAVAAREYLQTLLETDAQIDAVAGALEQKLAILEEMGYKGRDPNRVHDRARVTLPRVTFKQLLAVVVISLVIWGGYSLHVSTTENAARQPGGIHGTLMIRVGEGAGTLQPLPFRSIFLYRGESDTQAILSKLRSKSPVSAWKTLGEAKGFPKSAATCRTDNVGNFKFEGLPPGDYYLAATSPSEENPVAWFVPVQVLPLKLGRINLRVENAVTTRM